MMKNTIILTAAMAMLGDLGIKPSYPINMPREKDTSEAAQKRRSKRKAQRKARRNNRS
jgi:hypothetical protein